MSLTGREFYVIIERVMLAILHHLSVLDSGDLGIP